VAHAIAATGGLTEDTADVIEIHRRGRYQNGVNQLPGYPMQGSDGKQIIRIPLRGSLPHGIRAEDVILHAGDVVFVPSRRHEVFYVVGQLSSNNSVRFTVGDRERELGVGFILARDREIDVVTAVVMARYIDPIDSPTTATVQLCRLLRRLAVQPDAAFCLLIPTERSLQRSRVRSRYNWETLDVLQQRCDEYRALGTELGVEILDGNQPAASLAETPQSKLEGLPARHVQA
jgi:hypothetical protein